MSMFDFLPTVNNCCCCISLKWGSILICIFTILSFGLTSFAAYEDRCGEKGGFHDETLRIVNICAAVIHGLLVIASFVFIFGIIMLIPATATWFMILMVASMIASLVLAVLSIVFYLTVSDCKLLPSIIGTSIGLLISFYLIVVVKSYQQEM